MRTSKKIAIALGAITLAAATAIGYVRAHPPLVHFRLAEWLDRLGEAELADEHLRRSVSLGLEHPGRLREAALELLHRDAAEPAFTAAQRLRERGALTPALRTAIAGHLDRLGEPGRARSLYEGAEGLSPAGTMHYAALLRRNEEYGPAIDRYRELLERLPPEPAAPETPTRAEVRLAWAETLAWAGDYARAVAVLDGLLAAHPGHRPAQLLQARVLAWAERPEDAIEAYRRYLGDAP